MRDGGDQLGAAALEPGALLRAAQRDDQPVDRAGAAVTDVADRDEQLAAVGEVQRPLRVPGAGRQAVVRVDEQPPVAAVLVAELQHVEDVLADGLLGRDARSAGRRPG